MSGKLFLVPVTLGSSAAVDVIPDGVVEKIKSLSCFIVENERSARRYLIRLGIKTPVDQIDFFVLDKHIRPDDMDRMLAPLAANRDVGLMSEAGVPAVADPGAGLITLAHKKGIRVIPLVGPSSVLLALMGSGLNGQNFAFNGYLPVKQAERIRSIRALVQKSIRENQSQLFMETPYRNRKLLDDLITHCDPTTRLCIAADLTLPTELLRTQTIGEWKSRLPDLHKRPAIFILQG